MMKMSTALVTINSLEVTRLEWNGEPVVTFTLIDQVHGRPEGTANRAFNYQKDRFTEKEHYFRLTGQKARDFAGVNEFRRPQDCNLVYVLTQRGYLMIVKVFNDDLAWRGTIVRPSSWRRWWHGSIHFIILWNP
jgi:hypothetical protein